jgi:5-hydroxyisourate hydrolase
MISTHILDQTRGIPAKNVTVSLEVKQGSEWKSLLKSKTDNDGRIRFDCKREIGIYRLLFQTKSYFAELTEDCFFPEVPIIFEINDTERGYHVPLLLNPFGYSTYRGS